MNVAGTQNVVDACLHCNVKRLVYFSSIHAFAGPSENTSVDDFSQLIDSDKCAPYDRSKALAERYVKQKMETDALNAVIISPTGIIGPFDYKPSYFGKALLLLAKRKLPVILDGGFDWVDVRDVVDGAIVAEETAVAGSKYILSGHWASLPEIAEIISQIIGVRSPGLTIPEALAKAAVPFSNIISRVTKKNLYLSDVTVQSLYSRWTICSHNAISELNYKPRPLTESLQDTLQWFIENGYLTHSKIMSYRENN
jgi:dihydroflavonol-4-reductase